MAVKKVKKRASKAAGKRPAVGAKRGPRKRGGGSARGKTRKVGPAKLRSLAAEGRTMAEAAEALGVEVADLAAAIGGTKAVRDAWDRGRLLWNVGPASYGASVDETAAALRMSPDDFRKLLAADAELRDHRQQLQINLLQRATAALMAEAVPEKTPDGKGKAANVSALREILRRIAADVGGEGRKVDFTALPVGQAVLALGRTRETLSQWTKKGAPRNSDGSVNLPAIILWREDELGARATRGGPGPGSDELLRRQRIEKLRIENQAKRGELLPRVDVILGLLARGQIIRRAVDTRPAVLAEILQGQPPAKIRETLEKEFTGVLLEIVGMPIALALSKDQAGRLGRLEAEIVGLSPSGEADS